MSNMPHPYARYGMLCHCAIGMLLLAARSQAGEGEGSRAVELGRCEKYLR